MVLGIIAGGGSFPCIVAQNARQQGIRTIGVGFLSDTDPEFANLCDTFTWLKLGQLARMLEFFTTHQVTHVVMAGPINKPRAMDLRPDWRAAKLLFRLKSKGDDSLLRAVGEELEQEGLQLIAPHQFCPELCAPPGILTKRKPTVQEASDIVLGWKIAKHLGPYDIGQCLVLRKGVVLAVEAIEGTDAAIRRAGTLAGAGAVVIKRPKITQDKRLDLPAVGPETIRSMIAAQATCLALEAKQTLIFDLKETIHLADKHSIAIESCLEQTDWPINNMTSVLPEH